MSGFDNSWLFSRETDQTEAEFCFGFFISVNQLIKTKHELHKIQALVIISVHEPEYPLGQKWANVDAQIIHELLKLLNFQVRENLSN